MTAAVIGDKRKHVSKNLSRNTNKTEAYVTVVRSTNLYTLRSFFFTTHHAKHYRPNAWPKRRFRVKNIIKVCGELDRGSSVGLIGIENTLRAGRSEIRIPVRKILLFSKSTVRLWDSSSLLCDGCRDTFRR